MRTHLWRNKEISLNLARLKRIEKRINKKNWNNEHATSPLTTLPPPPTLPRNAVGTQGKHCIRFRMPKCLMPKATFIILNQLYVLLASADDGMSQLLWPSIIVGIVAVLVVVMIVIVLKQKWWMRANSQRNLEVCERNDYSFVYIYCL